MASQFPSKKILCPSRHPWQFPILPSLLGLKTNIFSLSAKTFISSPQMFTPAMGFYSQTCKRAKDLAFHSRPGTLEMNLFLYLFLLTEHFVAEKERCSVQIHQRGRSEMGSVWYLAKVQAPCYSTQLFRVRLKILWGKNFWEKKLKLHFGKYSHTIADKKNCTFETSIMQRWDKSARNWHLLFFRKVNGKRYKGTFIFILMDFQNLVWSQWTFKTQNY